MDKDLMPKNRLLINFIDGVLRKEEHVECIEMH